MKKTFKFELGMEVKDKITGYSGIIMSRIQYLTGCVQYEIQNPNLTKEGQVREWLRFDEDALVKIRKAPIKKKVSNPGGPATHPVRIVRGTK